MVDTDLPERTGSCTVCARRDPDPMDVPVCFGCRTWMPVALRSIAEMYPRLHALLQPGRAGGPRVGGTRDKPVPISLHIADLLCRVARDGGRPVDVTGDNWVPKVATTAVETLVWAGYDWAYVGDVEDETKRGAGIDIDAQPRSTTTTIVERRPVRDDRGRLVMAPAGDQVGQLPIAQVLDQEMRAWAESGAPGAKFRPTPTVAVLVEWLLRRLDWACDHYGGIDATAETLRRLRGQMMGALGELDDDPPHCDGVACKRCDRQTLYRRQDGSGDVECVNPDCVKIYSSDEFRDWTVFNGAYERGRRTPEQIRELLRPGYQRPADPDAA